MATTAAALGHSAHAHVDDRPFIRKYIFSTDHKIIGVQFLLLSLVFLALGGMLAMMMRWQLAFPGQPLPLIGKLFSDAVMPGGVMLPDFYNQLGAMHGTIMVFMGIVPLAVGAFGNFVLPLQIGAPDVAFPRLNALAYWLYLFGGLVMISGFLTASGAANFGWFAYAPLSGATYAPGAGPDLWIVGVTVRARVLNATGRR